MIAYLVFLTIILELFLVRLTRQGKILTGTTMFSVGIFLFGVVGPVVLGEEIGKPEIVTVFGLYFLLIPIRDMNKKFYLPETQKENK